MAHGVDNVGDYVDFQTVVLCDGCGGMVNVSSYCINCPGNLCDICKANHPKSKLTRNHRVLPRNHPAVVKVRRSICLPCKLHPEYEYVTYCKKCQIPCCVSCITQKHNGHSFCELEEIGKESRTKVAKFIQNLECSLLPIREEAALKLREKKEENQTQKMKHAFAVKQKVKYLKKQLDTIESDALTHVINLYSARIEEITLHHSMVEESLKTVTDAIAKFKARLKECSNIEAVVLLSECPTLESFHLPDISISQLPQLKHSSYNLPPFAEAVGEIIRPKEKEIIYCNSQRQSENKRKAAKKLTEAGKEQNRKKSPPPQFQESLIEVETEHAFSTDVVPYSMVHSNSNDIWIAGGSTFVKLDNKGAALTKFLMHFAVADIALSPSQDIIATDTKSECIVRISPTGDTTDMLRTAPLSPRGICINDRQQLVVGLGYGAPPIKLVVYDLTNGMIVQEIEKDDKGNPMFNYDLYKVKQSGNGDYIVADTNYFYPKDDLVIFYCLGNVICLSGDGRHRWVYDVKYVSDVACDVYHNVIFCERWECKIGLLDSEGNMIRTLLTRTDGLCHPLSVSMNSEGLLYVGQTDKKVLKVRYLKDGI